MLGGFMPFQQESVADFLSTLVTFDTLMHCSTMSSKYLYRSISTFTLVTFVRRILFMLRLDMFFEADEALESLFTMRTSSFNYILLLFVAVYIMTYSNVMLQGTVVEENVWTLVTNHVRDVQFFQIWWH